MMGNETFYGDGLIWVFYVILVLRSFWRALLQVVTKFATFFIVIECLDTIYKTEWNKVAK